MSREDPIRGTVATVLSTREVVINRGKKHGVSLGDIFAILDPRGLTILDPETQEPLEPILRPKTYVKVSRVTDNSCAAKTFLTRRVNVGGLGKGGLELGSLASILSPPRWVERVETLKTDEARWEELPEKDSFVKRGDPVEQVFDSEQDLASLHSAGEQFVA